MKTKPPSHMSYEGSALHFLRKRRNKEWQDCHSSQQINSVVLDGFRRCKGNFRLFPCTVKTDVRRDTLSLDIKQFQSQHSEVVFFASISIDMLLGFDNNTVHGKGLDLSGHDGWFGLWKVYKAVL